MSRFSLRALALVALCAAALAPCSAAGEVEAAPRPRESPAELGIPPIPAATFCDFVQSLSILSCTALDVVQTALLGRGALVCGSGGEGTAGQIQPVATALDGERRPRR
jgi:hypothetical protein